MDDTPTTGASRSRSDSRALVPLLFGLSVVAVFVIMALPAQTLSWLRSEFWMIGWPLNWLESHTTSIDFDHVAMFFLLGFFWKLLSPATRWWRIALMMLALAAATELMQYAVPGRTPKLADIRDDLLGAVVGWCLGWLALRIARWIGACLRRRPAVVDAVDGAAGNTQKRLRFYRHSQRVVERLPGKIQALVRACMLGLLDDDAKDELTRTDYMGASGFEAPAFNIERGLWPWEVDAIGDAFPASGSILVAGAGGGREAIALARAGFEVTAFDGADDLVEACKRNARAAGVTVKVHRSAQSAVPAGLERYDALLVGRGFYHHIPRRERRIMFLRQCRLHLRPDAALIVGDFHVRPPRSAIHTAVWKIGDGIRRLRRGKEAVELGDYVTGSFQHAFVPEEIAAELQASGFRLLEWRETPFGEDSRLAHVLGKADS